MENRVGLELGNWKKREERFEQLFPGSVQNNRPFQEEKLRFIERLQLRFGANGNVDERLMLKMLQQERNKIEQKLYPGLVSRLLNRVIRQYRQHKTRKTELTSVKANNRSLHDQVTRAGFGQTIPYLEQMMALQKPEISLPKSYYVHPGERMDINLEFSQTDNGTYQIKGFTASLKMDTDNQPRKHLFEVGKVTEAQAYNLLSGRAIYNEKNKVWNQFDLNDKESNGNYRVKVFPQGYGFDLEKELQQIPKDVPITDEIINKLKNGEVCEVTLSRDNTDHRFFISANPQRNNLAVFDSQMKPVNMDKLNPGLATKQELTRQRKTQVKVVSLNAKKPVRKIR